MTIQTPSSPCLHTVQGSTARGPYHFLSTCSAAHEAETLTRCFRKTFAFRRCMLPSALTVPLCNLPAPQTLYLSPFPVDRHHLTLLIVISDGEANGKPHIQHSYPIPQQADQLPDPQVEGQSSPSAISVLQSSCLFTAPLRLLCFSHQTSNGE